jgi:hypothetical protein
MEGQTRTRLRACTMEGQKFVLGCISAQIPDPRCCRTTQCTWEPTSTFRSEQVILIVCRTRFFSKQQQKKFIRGCTIQIPDPWCCRTTPCTCESISTLRSKCVVPIMFANMQNNMSQQKSNNNKNASLVVATPSNAQIPDPRGCTTPPCMCEPISTFRSELVLPIRPADMQNNLFQQKPTKEDFTRDYNTIQCSDSWSEGLHDTSMHV